MASAFATHGGDVKAPYEQIKFDIHEGTSMSIDVSPSGRSIVFDLLGTLYTIPITGGVAHPLLPGGRAWDRYPRFAPDGSKLAFLSDRGGVDAVWVLDLASRQLRRVTYTRENGQKYVGANGAPEWTPDGRSIVFSFAGVRETAAYVAQTAGGPANPYFQSWTQPKGVTSSRISSISVAPSGRTIYFFMTMNSRNGAYASKPFETKLFKVDLDTGVTTQLTANILTRDEFRQALSRSGKYLAYVRSDDVGRSELRIRDLLTGIDRSLGSLSGGEPMTSHSMYGEDGPSYAFTPDDRFIIIWDGGKIRKVSVADGSWTTIPFLAHVSRSVAVPVRADFRISDGPLSVKALRWPTVSPNRRSLAFSAVGSIWMCDLPNCKPRRLSESDDFEFMPTYSPIGQRLAYIEFPHTEDQLLNPGKLWVWDFVSGARRQIASGSFSYQSPAWSPDGSKIAVVRQSLDGRRPDAQFGWIDLTDETFHVVGSATRSTPDFSYSFRQHISFSQSGDYLYYQKEFSGSVHRVNLDGSADQEIIRVNPNEVYGIYPSPDGTKAVLIDRGLEAFVVPIGQQPSSFTWTSRELEFSARAGARMLAREGALYPNWAGPSELIYGWTNHFYRVISGDFVPKPLASVYLSVPSKGGTETIVFRNARLITMAGERGAGPVIEQGTLIVRNRRIEYVGPTEPLSLPSNAILVDATGWTIIPGLIDGHFHGLWHQGPGTNLPSPLAYGVTTTFDARGSEDDGNLAEIELREAGRLTSQRWLTAAGIVNREDNEFAYDSQNAVVNIVRKKKQLGAEQCIKARGEKSRTLIQWYAKAARENGVCLITHTEQASELLAWAGDGAMIDHPMLPAPSYADVLQYLARIGSIWTTHALLTQSTHTPGLAAQRAFIDEIMEGHNEQQRRKFERYSQLADGLNGNSVLQNYMYVQSVPFAQTAAAAEAKVATALAAEGGHIAVSIDGIWTGIENHFEMWALARSGMPVGDVLRAATVTGAEKLGIEHDVGSLEPGKLADFLILTENPLARIENSLSLKYTVLGGVIYDSDTLDQISPTRIAVGQASGPVGATPDRVQ